MNERERLHKKICEELCYAVRSARSYADPYPELFTKAADAIEEYAMYLSSDAVERHEEYEHGGNP